ncbi:hypothetical protein OSB04_005504 [Centaurea solstitialis]|uniref:Uncharacterized protein n=1 Tax=Centaurea solstitialis TaxID=347529 RepID=A0AA38WRH0_9ASTR|nr:hypothetical protein OSB04_005504 [Centaurea solstitialis]
MDRLPTLINLFKRGITTLSKQLPALPKMRSKTGAHLFLECITSETEDGKTSQGYKNKEIKEAVFQAYTWAIRKDINDVVYNRRSFNPLLSANFIQASIYSSVCNYRSVAGRNQGWIDWICNARSF